MNKNFFSMNYQHSKTHQPSSEQPDSQPVPDGQERLATQAERDDVNETIDGVHPSTIKQSDQP